MKTLFLLRHAKSSWKDEPTACLAKIVAKVAKWSALDGSRAAKLEWLVKPKDLEKG